MQRIMRYVQVFRRKETFPEFRISVFLFSAVIYFGCCGGVYLTNTRRFKGCYLLVNTTVFVSI